MWHTTEHVIYPCLGPIHVRHECLSSQIILEIFNLLLPRTEAQFEPAQTFVCHRGSSHVQAAKPFAGQAFDCRPHHQIIWAEMLVGKIRGAKFVNGPLVVIKENSGRYRLPTKSSRHYKAVVF